VVARIIVPSTSESGGPVVLESPQKKRLDLAFDHPDIIGTALNRVRGRLDYTPVGFELLPAAFTLLDLQNVHETVLGRKLNKDSFRRRMLATGQIEATGEIQQDVDHRPAALYRFIRET
jgi:8-oxo-dGTP diphosphatase